MHEEELEGRCSELANKLSAIIAEGVEQGIRAFLALPGNERENRLLTLIDKHKAEIDILDKRIAEMTQKQNILYTAIDRMHFRIKLAKQFNDAAAEITDVLKVANALRKPELIKQ